MSVRSVSPFNLIPLLEFHHFLEHADGPLRIRNTILVALVERVLNFDILVVFLLLLLVAVLAFLFFVRHCYIP